MKKSLSIILTICLMLAILPTGMFSITASAATIDDVAFVKKINELKLRYRQDEYFSGNWQTGNNLTETNPILQCTGTNNLGTTCVEQHYCGGGGFCTCSCGTFYYNGQEIGSQCVGFACMMGYEVFGGNPYTWQTHKEAYNITAGDIVRFSWYSSSFAPHSIFVLKIVDGIIYYADCNASGPCQVNWYNSKSIGEIQNLLNNRSESEFAVYHASNNGVSKDPSECDKHIYDKSSVCTECGYSYDYSSTRINFQGTAQATENIYVRESPYEVGNLVNTYSSGTQLAVTGKVVNGYGNEWYVVVSEEGNVCYDRYVVASKLKLLSHTCQKGDFEYSLEAHPHYNSYKCKICGKSIVDYNSSNFSSNCNQCSGTDISAGTYAIKNNSTGTYMCVSYGTDANEQNVDLYGEINSASKMIISAAPNGYKIRPECCASRIINPFGDTVTSGINVNIYDDVNDSSQWWLFQSVSGGYVIRNVQNPNCVLDTEGGNVFVSSYTGASTQIWSLCQPSNPSLATPSISFDKSSYTLGDTITISWVASPSGSNLSHYWVTVLDSSGNAVVDTGVGNLNASFSFTPSVAGTYSVKIYATPTGSQSGEGSLTDTKSITVVAPHTHSYGTWTTRTAATCTSSGVDYRVCSCGNEETRISDPLGHDYVFNEIKPTCQESGYSYYICSTCSDMYTDSYTSPVEHNFKNGECCFCGLKYLEIPFEKSPIGFSNVSSNNYVYYDSDKRDNFSIIIGQINEGGEEGPTIETKIWTITNDGKTREFSWQDFFKSDVLEDALNSGLEADGSNLRITFETFYSDENGVAIGFWYGDYVSIYYTNDGINFEFASEPDDADEIYMELDISQFSNAQEYSKLDFICCYNGIYVIACYKYYEEDLFDTYFYLTDSFSYNLNDWCYLGVEEVGAGSWEYEFYKGEKGVFITKTLMAIEPYEKYILYTNDAKNFYYVGREPGVVDDYGFDAYISEENGKAYIMEFGISQNVEYYYHSIDVSIFDENTLTSEPIYSADHLEFNYIWWLNASTLDEFILWDSERNLIYFLNNGKQIENGKLLFDPYAEIYWHIVRDNEDGENLHHIYTLYDGELYISNDYFKNTYKIAMSEHNSFQYILTSNDGYAYFIGNNSYCAKIDDLDKSMSNWPNLSTVVTGDLDGVDGVTDRDAVHLLYHTFLPDMYPVNQDCDFNNDNEVNDKDAVYLLYYTFLPDLYPIN